MEVFELEFGRDESQLDDYFACLPPTVVPAGFEGQRYSDCGLVGPRT